MKKYQSLCSSSSESQPVIVVILSFSGLCELFEGYSKQKANANCEEHQVSTKFFTQIKIPLRDLFFINYWLRYSSLSLRSSITLITSSSSSFRLLFQVSSPLVKELTSLEPLASELRGKARGRPRMAEGAEVDWLPVVLEVVQTPLRSFSLKREVSFLQFLSREISYMATLNFFYMGPFPCTAITILKRSNRHCSRGYSQFISMSMYFTVYDSVSSPFAFETRQASL